MGTEGKYGTITTERGDIPDGEPVFLLRAQDSQAVRTIEAYLRFCSQVNSPPAHLEALDQVIGTFVAWQSAHPGRVKVPGTGRGTGRE